MEEKLMDTMPNWC